PADARAAFQRGAIDAWVIWDPYLAEVETNAKARQIRNAEGLVPHYTFYLASRKFAENHPDTAKQVVDELRQLSDWANAHQDDAAGILS
ncbi:ABC transporter substrate-binding protein, partial [Klebsiella pneumoniae]